MEFERFIAKVNKTNFCWLWTGAKYRFGYGHFRRKINNKWMMYKTHRYSYEHFYGPVPEGLLVLHKCDNPACVNPEHLYAGTHQQNIQDQILRGRKSFGRNKKHVWLNLEKANEFRQYAKDNPGMKQNQMAQNLGTSVAQLSRILNNKIWVQPV